MMDLRLSPDERLLLTGLLRATTVSAGLVRRARVILALADGESYAAIAAAQGVTDTYIARWKRRVVEGGLPALGDLPRSGRPDRLDPRIEANILATTRTPPPAPFTHWTTRRMAKLIGVSHVTVHRVWQRAGLQPHRLEHYVTSDDPDFETKADDVIGLYLKPPANAVVFSVDEKSHIQALDRLDPVLPLSPGRAERHGFEYKRNGTLSLYSALDVATGRVAGMTSRRHTSAEFVRFLTQLVARPRQRSSEIARLPDLRSHEGAVADEGSDRSHAADRGACVRALRAARPWSWPGTPGLVRCGARGPSGQRAASRGLR